MSMLIGKPNQSRQQRELDEANLALRGRKAVEGVKEVVQENLTTVTPTQPTISEEDAYVEKILTDQLEQAMHLMAEEARETLASNPADEAAKLQLLHYAQWARTKNTSPTRLVMTKKSKKTSSKPVGIWQRTRDYGWLVKVSGRATVGDTVDVRKKGGTTIPMELVEEVAPRYFKVRQEVF